MGTHDEQAGKEAGNPLAAQIGYLLAGRLFAFALMFFLPVVLARLLSQADFGLYRQFFVLFYALFTLLQLGMSVSLPAMIPRHREDTQGIVSAAVVLLGLVGLGCVLVGGVVQWVGGSHPLWGLGLSLGVFTGLMVASSPFEHLLVLQQRSRSVAVLIVLWDMGRGALMLGIALWTRDLALTLWVMSIAAVLRYVAMLLYVRSQFQLDPRAMRWRILRAQLREAGPLTMQAGAHLVEINIDRYIIMWLFTASAFAVYTVGAFQLPLVDMLFSSVCGVLLPILSAHHYNQERDSFVSMYRDAIRRMWLVLVPLVGALFVARESFIVLLFSERYADSVGIFAIYLWIIPTYATLSSLALQAMGHARFLSFSSIAKTVAAVLFVGVGSWLGGMKGVVLSLVLYHYFSSGLHVWLAARALGVPWLSVLPWRTGLQLAGWLVLIVLPLEWLWADAGWPLLLSFFGKPLLFLALFGAVLWRSSIVTDADRMLLHAGWVRLLRKLKLKPAPVSSVPSEATATQ